MKTWRDNADGMDPELFGPEGHRLFNPMQFEDPSIGKLPHQDRENMRYLAHSPVAVRAPLESIPSIARTGDLRNQHEVGDSRGDYNPRGRKSWEKRVGFPANPVYGYLDTQTHEQELVGAKRLGETHGQPRAEHYGEAKFTLNTPRSKVTVLNGDTLGVATPPRDLTAVRKDGEIPTGSEMFGNHRINGYMEAQVHGPVSETGNVRVPMSDVHSIEVDVDWGSLTNVKVPGPAREKHEAVIGLGEKYNVPVSFNVEEHRYQPPLPYTDDELLDQGFHVGDEQSTRYAPAHFEGTRGYENLTRGVVNLTPNRFRERVL